jgi:hypothetical protein
MKHLIKKFIVWLYLKRHIELVTCKRVYDFFGLWEA